MEPLNVFNTVKLKGLEFRMTCGACPEQYDVYEGTLQVGYVRLRHGLLRCDFPDCGGKIIYDKQLRCGGMFDDEKQRTQHLTAIAEVIRYYLHKKR